MNKLFLILGLSFLSAVFDVVSAPFPGFYFLPAVLSILIFFALPFIFDFLNFILAVITGFAAMLFWGRLHGFEYGGAYIFHLIIYFVLFLIMFYLSYGAPTKERNRI